jgi:glyoxylate reductase
MSKYSVVLTGRLLPPAQEKLQEHCDIMLWEKAGPAPQDLIREWLKDAEGLLSVGNIVINELLLTNATRLRVIAQATVGYDNIEIDVCTRKRIPVGNTPGVLVETTADLAFGLLICAARRIHESWAFVRAGKWTPSASIPFGVDLYGKTLGIVGMGRIGAAVARRARACGMRVIYSNRKRRPDEQELGAEYSEFDRLLESADCVLVLTPLSAETRGLFGRNQFGRMKSTALFVNAARGPIVDTDALTDALANNKIAYAALDVTDPEPLPVDHPLIKLPNVLITPHIGSATTETRTRMALLAVDNLLAGLARKPLPACVNPEVNYS